MLWVDVVNRSLEWETEAARGALALALGVPAVDAAALDAAVHALRAAAAAHLAGAGAATSTPASQWLAAVTLRPAAPEDRLGFELPWLRAARRGSLLPPPLDEILSTALVQLAANGAGHAARCAGLVRRAQAAGDPWGGGGARAAVRGGELVQCPRIVDGPRAGRYCSKACSNAAFAARKAARDPAYFARKQARYRGAQRRAAARVESAFAFVD